jgi:psiF repeat
VHQRRCARSDVNQKPIMSLVVKLWIVRELRIPTMLKRLALVSATLLPLVIGLGTAFAQAPPGQSSSAAKMSKADKEAISKACSEQANAQGLHGKARKTFRSKCKRTRGKAM